MTKLSYWVFFLNIYKINTKPTFLRGQGDGSVDKAHAKHRGPV